MARLTTQEQQAFQNRPVYQGTLAEYEQLSNSEKLHYKRPLDTRQQTGGQIYKAGGITALATWGAYGAPPIDTPEGYEIAGVEAQEVEMMDSSVSRVPYKEDVLTVTFVSKPEVAPKSLGEQIAEINPSSVGLSIAETIMGKQVPNKQEVTQQISNILGSGIPGVKGTPTEVLGGMVAAVEAPVYGMAGLVGVKGLPRPPTVSGAYISSGISSVMQGKFAKSQELKDIEQKSPAYQVGTVGGDIVLSYFIGKAVGKTASYVYKKTGLASKVSEKLTGSMKQAAESGEMWKPSFSEKALMKVTGTKPHLASELVAAGDAPPVSFKTLQSGSLGASEEAYFWDIPVPRTSQVYVAGVMGSRAKTWAGEHLIKGVSGGLSYAWVKQELTEKISPSMPYVPSEPPITYVSTISKSMLTGAGVIAISKLHGNALSQKTMLIQRLTPVQRSLQRQSLRQLSKQNEVVSEVLGTSQMQEQRQKQALVQVQQQTQTQKQIQTQMQKQALATVMSTKPSLTLTTSTLSGDFEPFRKGGVPPLLRLWGRGERKHKILTVKELLEAYGL